MTAVRRSLLLVAVIVVAVGVVYLVIAASTGRDSGGPIGVIVGGLLFSLTALLTRNRPPRSDRDR